MHHSFSFQREKMVGLEKGNRQVRDQQIITSCAFFLQDVNTGPAYSSIPFGQVLDACWGCWRLAPMPERHPVKLTPMNQRTYQPLPSQRTSFAERTTSFFFNAPTTTSTYRLSGMPVYATEQWMVRWIMTVQDIPRFPWHLDKHVTKSRDSKKSREIRRPKSRILLLCNPFIRNGIYNCISMSLVGLFATP